MLFNIKKSRRLLLNIIFVFSRQLRERGHEVKILTLSRTFHSYIEGDVVYAGDC